MKRTILTLTMVLASSVCSHSYGFDLLDRMLGMKGSGTSGSCCEAPCDDNICCEPACGAESTGCGLTSCEPACGCESKHGSCLKGLFNHGNNECGCESACETPCEPACGCESKHGSCLKGLLNHGKNGCEPACGCESSLCGETSCGCETACVADPCCDSQGCGSKKACCGGLLSKLFNKKGHGCCDSDPCEVACGCETVCEAPACDSCGHGKKKCGLLSKMFGKLNCCKDKSNCCDAGCDSYASSDCGCGSTSTVPYAAPVQAPAVQQNDAVPPAPIVDPSASISRNRRVIQASASYAR